MARIAPVPLLFGLHNHQPFGNFDSVIEYLTDQCYSPFLEHVEDYNFFRFSLHVSGFLLKWWEQHSPELIDRIANLCDQGRVELLAGGFYEPVLAAWDSQDRVDQIEMLKSYLKDRFGQTPKGLWLTERVWEQQVVEDIASCGIDYVLVDDRHFLVSGFRKEDLYGYYLTESNGKSVAVFPIDENLRYAIPFHEPEQIETYLRKIQSAGKMAIYVDDGEKFGAWPGTYDWVYRRRWLERFLDAASAWQNDLAVFRTFSDILKDIPPEGLCYLPTASYDEMEQWALPYDSACQFSSLKKMLKEHSSEGYSNEDYSKFLRGGHWKNFLVKYPESNYMQKRVQELSRKTRSENCPPGARDMVLAAQCNDAYWHGVFGGLYLPHLRQGIWSSLLKAEGMLRTGTQLTFERKDIDIDGRQEILVGSDRVLWGIRPSCGQIIEISSLRSEHNYLNTLTRRPEPYHNDIRENVQQLDMEAQESENTDDADESQAFSIHEIDKRVDPELLEELSYDWYERHCLVDHFFDPNTGLSDFKHCDFREWGDFANQPFDSELDPEKRSVIMSRSGGIYPMGSKIPIILSKELVFSEDATELSVCYTVENKGETDINVRFGIEWSLFPRYLATGEGTVTLDRTEKPRYSEWEDEGRVLVFHDGVLEKLVLELDQDATLWYFPVSTVSQSEGGYDKTVQGIAVMAFWNLNLVPNTKLKRKIIFNIKDL